MIFVLPEYKILNILKEREEEIIAAHSCIQQKIYRKLP